MTYADARSQIKSGDVLAWRGKSLLARLIEWVTGGAYSHVGIAYWLEDRLMVVQQREFTGQDMAFLSDNLPFDWISTNITLSTAAKGVMFEQLEHPYSYLDAVRIGLAIAARKQGRICSTFAAQVLDACGFDLPDRVQSPSSLVAALLKQGAALQSLQS